MGIAKLFCLVGSVSPGAALNWLPLCTRPFRCAKGCSGGQRETDVLPFRSTADSLLAVYRVLSLSHIGSPPYSAAAGAVRWGGKVEHFTAAGRNARGGTVSPFNTHAPAIKEHRTAGIREFLEPQVLSQLLPTFVWRQK